MAQVKFGTCIDEFAPRSALADQAEPFIGSVEQYDRGYGPLWCNKEQTRRDDGLIPSFGNKRAAQTAKMTLPGLADPISAPSETFQTQAGTVSIAKEQDTWQYLPSIDTLKILTTSTGSRLQPLPARFYHR